MENVAPLASATGRTRHPLSRRDRRCYGHAACCLHCCLSCTSAPRCPLEQQSSHRRLDPGVCAFLIGAVYSDAQLCRHSTQALESTCAHWCPRCTSPQGILERQASSHRRDAGRAGVCLCSQRKRLNFQGQRIRGRRRRPRCAAVRAVAAPSIICMSLRHLLVEFCLSSVRLP